MSMPIGNSLTRKTDARQYNTAQRFVSIRSIWFHLFSATHPSQHGKSFSQNTKKKINTQKLDVLFRSRCINFLNYERLFWNPMNAHYFNGCLFRFFLNASILNSDSNAKLWACSTGVMPHYKWKTNCSLSQLLYVMSEKINATQFIYELYVWLLICPLHMHCTWNIRTQKSYGTFRSLCA